MRRAGPPQPAAVLALRVGSGSSPAPTRPRARPADGLLHPVPLVAMLLLALNDHWWKAAFPGVLTGKISDFAGLAFFPLLLQALWEVVTRSGSTRRVLVTVVVVTGVVFATTKTVPAATQLWAWSLGILQWPVLTLTRGQPTPVPVLAVTDPTDLIALPALGVALAVGWRRAAG